MKISKYRYSIDSPNTLDWIEKRANTHNVSTIVMTNAMLDFVVTVAKRHAYVLTDVINILNEKRKHEIAEPRVATRTRRKVKS